MTDLLKEAWIETMFVLTVALAVAAAIYVTISGSPGHRWNTIDTPAGTYECWGPPNTNPGNFNLTQDCVPTP